MAGYRGISNAFASVSVLTPPLPVEAGGTNSVTPLQNNRIIVSSGGAIVEAAAITPTRALASNASGIPVAVATTTTELGYVAGVTSAIQTQLDSGVTSLATKAIGVASAVDGEAALFSGTGGKQLKRATGTGVALLTSGVMSASTVTAAQLLSTPVWTKYTVAYTDLAAAALTNNIQIVSLAAKTVVHAIVMKPTIAFTGTATYTISVGVTGVLTKYIAASDVEAAVANTTFYTQDASFVAAPENFGASVSVRAAAVSTVDNLDQASAGSVDIYIQTSLLP